MYSICCSAKLCLCVALNVMFLQHHAQYVPFSYSCGAFCIFCSPNCLLSWCCKTKMQNFLTREEHTQVVRVPKNVLICHNMFAC
jgi:hypothetical protein